MIELGDSKKTQKKSCDNCMRRDYCEGKGKKCFEHQSLNQKLNRLHMTFEEWDLFKIEWGIATMAVRRKLGYGSRREN